VKIRLRTDKKVPRRCTKWADCSGLVVRMRLDGMLRVMEIHPKDLAARIISRVKVMAGLDIAERRLLYPDATSPGYREA
jgi:hypothetical protein